MGLVATNRSAAFGLGLEAIIGTRVNPTFGLENIDQGSIQANQTFANDRKAHGAPFERQVDKKADRLSPTFDTTLAMNIPNMGILLALCAQNVLQTGTGPYSQLVTFPTNGVRIEYGAARSVNGQTATVVEKDGQSGNRNLGMYASIIQELSFTFGEGRVKPKAKFIGLTYADDDAGTGVYTLPATDVLGRDVVFMIGDGAPTALYSDEVTVTIRSVVTPHWYAGVRPSGMPFALICSDWTGEVSFTKPLVTAANSFSRDYFVNGGGVSNDLLMYIYSRSVATSASALVANEFRFTLNISPDDVKRQLADETNDTVTASLKYDGVNQPFLYEQCTAASQAAWAS